MSRRLFVPVPSALITLYLSLASAGAAQEGAPSERIGWLSGCWSRTTAISVVEEQWMAPRGGTLLGMSRTTTNGAVREYEHLRIFTKGDTLVYAASPSGQAYTEFRSKTIDAREIVFENLNHDYPQRIGYKSISRDSPLAYIEGPNGGTTRRINFPLVRTACPGAAP